MKCPKCSFVSFDYNQACPKCGNDLSREKDVMNLPSYKPRPLSLLGSVAAGGDMSSVDRLGGLTDEQMQAGAGAEELLISLESFSDEEPEPIQFEPEPSLVVPHTDIQAGSDGMEDELSISIDDLSDEAPQHMQLDNETEASIPGLEHDIVLDPEAVFTGDHGKENADFWEVDAVEQRMADIQLDSVSRKDEVAPEAAQGTHGKDREDEEDLFELELEPLDLDMEIEEFEKKAP